MGWLPPSYTIDLPDDDEDPMMDDVHHFLLCSLTTPAIHSKPLHLVALNFQVLKQMKNLVKMTPLCIPSTKSLERLWQKRTLTCPADY